MTFMADAVLRNPQVRILYVENVLPAFADSFERHGAFAQENTVDVCLLAIFTSQPSAGGALGLYLCACSLSIVCVVGSSAAVVLAVLSVYFFVLLHHESCVWGAHQQPVGLARQTYAQQAGPSAIDETITCASRSRYSQLNYTQRRL